ncbi:MAG TPA: DNA alkylation repair protein [Terriglobia bacterium]|nr:DNA alkylation repair protein [Terriglobia bacterium]
MPSVESVMASLKKKGSEKTRAIYARHGLPADRALGVSMADLKVIAKTIKGQQTLACQLYETGIVDAMYLAGIVADGSKMAKRELQAWAEGAAGMPMISEYTVPWVTVESAYARDLAMEWVKSKREHLASSGWCTYSGLAATRTDDALDLDEIASLLRTVVKEIGKAPNRARYTMNGFVIAVGTYVKPLLDQAKGAANEIGAVSVDMGDTACQVPLATALIAKVEAAGRVGKKKKTIRC